MKKKIFIAVFIFFTGFCFGVIFSDCMAQAVKGGVIIKEADKTDYTMPEVYELMQVAIALTDTSIVTNQVKMYENNVETNTAYYKEVIQKFGTYKNHPLVKKLNKSFSKSALNYVYQLQKAYNADFDDKEVVKNKQMPLIRRIWIGINSVTRNDLEKFAGETGFREFYNAHLPYYNTLLLDVKNKLAISKIQSWLEKQFAARYNKYKIIISPLTKGFHFTQNFKYKNDKVNIIWISAPTQYDTAKLTQLQIAALYTSVAFTEIDHNYINPVTDIYKKELNEIMGGDNRSNWINESGDAAFYKNGYKVFNEYMTHAVYLLYIKDTYGETEYETVAASKIKGMVTSRKYYRFKEFYETLLQLYLTKAPNATITDLYPAIIKYCKTISK